MADDNIPHPDPEFDGFFDQIHTYITANAADLGLTPDQLPPLAAAKTTWDTAYPAHKTAASAAGGAARTKEHARSGAEQLLRPIIQQIQANPKVTDEQRKAMNIHVRSKTRTSASIPTTAPMATIDTSQRLRHVINYRDSAAANSRKKPAGVAYCEIWAKVGSPAPTGVGDLAYLGNATQTPQLEEFTGAQAGMTVYYWLRWVNTLGQKGPWSEQVSATIQG
jgi:hypothetical protein